eukprot:7208242-Prymnesium_polylepis.1
METGGLHVRFAARIARRCFPRRTHKPGSQTSVETGYAVDRLAEEMGVCVGARSPQTRLGQGGASRAALSRCC